MLPTTLVDSSIKLENKYLDITTRIDFNKKTVSSESKFTPKKVQFYTDIVRASVPNSMSD